MNNFEEFLELNKLYKLAMDQYHDNSKSLSQLSQKRLEAAKKLFSEQIENLNFEGKEFTPMFLGDTLVEITIPKDHNIYKLSEVQYVASSYTTNEEFNIMLRGNEIRLQFQSLSAFEYYAEKFNFNYPVEVITDRIAEAKRDLKTLDGIMSSYVARTTKYVHE